MRARTPEAALTPTADPGWVLTQDGYDALHEHAIESRFAISNGFLGVRGARSASRGPVWISWLHSLGWAAWPRSFVAGLFDVPESEPRVPALVPAPDWLRLRILLDGEPVSMGSGQLLVHRRTLDLRRGLLLSEWRQRDSPGRVLTVRTLRAVSLSDRAVGLQLASVVADGPGELTLEPRLELPAGGLEPVRIMPRLGLWRTTYRRRYLAVASASGLDVGGERARPEGGGWLNRAWTWQAEPTRPAIFWRLIGAARGESPAAPMEAAGAALERVRRTGWRDALAAHEAAWAERWAAGDVEVDGDPWSQRALRLAIYHLIGAANPDDERVSIGARALTGEAYLGHVFWDTEIFALPFYTFTWPEAARALLMYRYHTLPAARAKAAAFGYRGALYAWESADTGEEVTPEWISLPNGTTIHVLCGLQEHHISADVAYAVWQYWQVSGDDEFFRNAGAEIILETARFWASRAALEADGRYHIRTVIGPDEYHESVDDNAYTNVMAQWNLERGAETVALFRERWPERWSTLRAALSLTEDEPPTWLEVAERLETGFDPASGLLDQFAGYHELEPIDLSLYEGRSVAMDVLLGQERTRRSQVVKQADVVMLLALLPHRFEPRVYSTNYDYYEPRCSHGSSLSRAMHALVAARLGRLDRAAEHFRQAGAIDLEDSTGSASGGVHIATQGGIWQAAVLGFAGLTVRKDGLALAPHLPEAWTSLAFRIQYRGSQLHVRLERASSLITATLERGGPITLHVGGQPRVVGPNEPLSDSWDSEPPAVIAGAPS